MLTLPKDASDPWVSWTDEETGRNINYRIKRLEVGPQSSYLRRIKTDRWGQKA